MRYSTMAWIAISEASPSQETKDEKATAIKGKIWGIFCGKLGMNKTKNKSLGEFQCSFSVLINQCAHLRCNTPPPPQRGISAILARHHLKTRQNVCDTPSAMPSRKSIARYGGVSGTGALKLCFVAFAALRGKSNLARQKKP